MAAVDTRSVEIPLKNSAEDVIVLDYTGLPSVDEAKGILIQEDGRLSLWHTLAVSMIILCHVLTE